MMLRVNSTRRRKAFTLVETMVGVALFGITFLSLFAGMAQGFASMRMARENLRATQIILEKLEVVRLYSWQRLNDPTYFPRGFETKYAPSPAPGTWEGVTYEGMISVLDPPFSANYSSKVKLITVEVKWNTGATPRSRKLSTLVTFDGLHTYVY